LEKSGTKNFYMPGLGGWRGRSGNPAALFAAQQKVADHQEKCRGAENPNPDPESIHVFLLEIVSADIADATAVANGCHPRIKGIGRPDLGFQANVKGIAMANAARAMRKILSLPPALLSGMGY
jgi:hypothetical protein